MAETRGRGGPRGVSPGAGRGDSRCSGAPDGARLTPARMRVLSFGGDNQSLWHTRDGRHPTKHGLPMGRAGAGPSELLLQ